MKSFLVSGQFSQPTKGIVDFEFTIYPGEPHVGNVEVPVVGVILTAKTAIETFITVSDLEFQTLLTLATSGHLKYVSCAFQEPRYGSGLMTYFSFSSDPIPEDQ